ncbi:MAG: sulfotransferase domain-containing protein [Hyphomicrobiales bacterium]|nr:sulfotransferase domain-containing protein [Hyphomicrobiales bacterium]
MAADRPTRSRIYQNHHLDNTRWDAIAYRGDDVVVATPYKCGTTWTQSIVLHLIFQDLQPRPIFAVSPWIEFRATDLNEIRTRLRGQAHRRCVKSHVPIDGIPFDGAVRYIVVGRDPRDVFMSLWNHYSHYNAAAYAEFNDTPGRVGDPCPPCPDDVRTFWSWWIKRGWFDEDTEGYPFWSNFRHIQSWWDFRHLPNILFVHYNDLLARPKTEISRIADFLDIGCSDSVRDTIADAVSFRSMKAAADEIAVAAADIFDGGTATFINKGTNGRWRSILTPGDLRDYQETAARELSSDCRQWLEGAAT